jgi:hypothetical protein
MTTMTRPDTTAILFDHVLDPELRALMLHMGRDGTPTEALRRLPPADSEAERAYRNRGLLSEAMLSLRWLAQTLAEERASREAEREQTTRALERWAGLEPARAYAAPESLDLGTGRAGGMEEAS